MFMKNVCVTWMKYQLPGRLQGIGSGHGVGCVWWDAPWILAAPSVPLIIEKLQMMLVQYQAEVRAVQPFKVI